MEYKFDDIVIHSRTGLNPRKNFTLGSGECYYITIKDIKEDKIIFSDKTDKIEHDALKIINKRSQLKLGDILFSSIGRIGDTAIIDEEPLNWNINESVFAFTLNDNIINSRYFCWMFKSPKMKEWLTINSSGSTFKSIKMNQLKKLSFNLPDLFTQEKIVEKLSNLHKIIIKSKNILKLYDDLVKSQFIEMFGDPITNNKNWKTDKLQNIIAINKYKGNVEVNNGKVWLLNLDMIESNSGNILGAVYENEEDIPNSTIKFNSDCVLYSKLRPYLNKVVIPHKSGYATSELISMNPNSLINKYFLANLLRYDSFVNFANGTSYGAKMPRASVDEIKNFKLIMPPIDLQNKFANIVQQIDKSKFIVQKQIKLLEELLEKKMNEYFGE